MYMFLVIKVVSFYLFLLLIGVNLLVLGNFESIIIIFVVRHVRHVRQVLDG